MLEPYLLFLAFQSPARETYYLLSVKIIIELEIMLGSITIEINVHCRSRQLGTTSKERGIYNICIGNFGTAGERCVRMAFVIKYF